MTSLLNSSVHSQENFPQTDRVGGEHAHHGHAVQFYSDDSILLDELGYFIGSALETGDGALVVATADHTEGLAQRLKLRGIDLAAAEASGRYVCLDASETLDRFTRNGMPDETLFNAFVGTALDRTRAAAKGNNPQVVVFGEMVALLWADGKANAALRLEQLWNGIATTQPFRLHCAYPISGFRRKKDRRAFLKIAAEHDAVVSPPELGPIEPGTGVAKNQPHRLRKPDPAEPRLSGDAAVRTRKTDLQNQNLELLERVKKYERSEINLRTLSTRLLNIRDAERQQIARELQDDIAQHLAVLGMNLGILNEEKSLSPRANRLVLQSGVLIEDLLGQVRNLSYLLHPPALEEMGLAGALQWYVEGFIQRHRIPVRLEVDERLGRLAPDFEIAIFRMVQESLINVQRHSGSAHAKVRLFQSADSVFIEIIDQGKGISPERMAFSPADVRTGIGIRGMHERALQLGGNLSVQSDSHGTTVSASFPLVRPARPNVGWACKA